mmetsp:Transcript_73713/g.204191  ORF Transcript_73713/g.204191 Transcript_73713/m.204191 type:complete len:81 (+) Transcript_73713:166-408(+)
MRRCRRRLGFGLAALAAAETKDAKEDEAADDASNDARYQPRVGRVRAAGLVDVVLLGDHGGRAEHVGGGGHARAALGHAL